MRLSRKKAIELCIELWTWLAETGKKKGDWPEWEKYGHINFNCWFCEYDLQRRGKNKDYQMLCRSCPLGGGFNKCLATYYDNWGDAKTPRARKKYAKLFLKQIKQLLTNLKPVKRG